MGPLILISSLLLVIAQGDSQTPPAPSTQGPASSPPKAAPPAPPPPKPDVDPGIQLPPNRLPQPPQTPSQPDRPKDDSVKPKDDSVKPVQPAPAVPNEPGVRPL